VIDDTDDWPQTDGDVLFSAAIETQAAMAPVVSAPTISDIPALMSDSEDCSGSDNCGGSDDEVMTQPKKLSNRESWAMRNLKMLKDEDANNGQKSRRVFQHIQGWVAAKAAAVIDLVSDEDSSDTMMSDPRQLEDEPGFETLGKPLWRHVHGLRVLGLLKDEDSSNGKNCLREFRRIQEYVAAEAAATTDAQVEEHVEYQHKGSAHQHVVFNEHSPENQDLPATSDDSDDGFAPGPVDLLSSSPRSLEDSSSDSLDDFIDKSEPAYTLLQHKTLMRFFPITCKHLLDSGV
jgi:hypothetical protein